MVVSTASNDGLNVFARVAVLAVVCCVVHCAGHKICVRYERNCCRLAIGNVCDGLVRRVRRCARRLNGVCAVGVQVVRCHCWQWCSCSVA